MLLFAHATGASNTPDATIPAPSPLLACNRPTTVPRQKNTPRISNQHKRQLEIAVTARKQTATFFLIDTKFASADPPTPTAESDSPPPPMLLSFPRTIPPRSR